jgi:hypothetical protein
MISIDRHMLVTRKVVLQTESAARSFASCQPAGRLLYTNPAASVPYLFSLWGRLQTDSCRPKQPEDIVKSGIAV